ncbi:uncharacterized protein LOC144275497 [Eretmochelys imbricata]
MLEAPRTNCAVWMWHVSWPRHSKGFPDRWARGRSGLCSFDRSCYELEQIDLIWPQSTSEVKDTSLLYSWFPLEMELGDLQDSSLGGEIEVLQFTAQERDDDECPEGVYEGKSNGGVEEVSLLDCEVHPPPSRDC